MTKSEAVIHLSLAADDDLDDCIEMALFKAKQELIQKADNVFIFPAKEKRLSLLQEAANTLGHSFPEEVRLQRVPISTETIETAFHSFQRNRSMLLEQLNRVNSFAGLIAVQQSIASNYREWALFWDLEFLDDELEDVKRTSILDSMRFLQWILELKDQGIEQTHLLKDLAIPADVKHEIYRLKIVLEKLK
jgi:hypothetical protein